MSFNFGRFFAICLVAGALAFMLFAPAAFACPPAVAVAFGVQAHCPIVQTVAVAPVAVQSYAVQSALVQPVAVQSFAVQSYTPTAAVFAVPTVAVAGYGSHFSSVAVANVHHRSFANVAQVNVARVNVTNVSNARAVAVAGGGGGGGSNISVAATNRRGNVSVAATGNRSVRVSNGLFGGVRVRAR